MGQHARQSCRFQTTVMDLLILQDALELRPSANAKAYADYVAGLGLRCTEGEDAAEIESAALR